MAEKSRKPKIRFAGFTEAWEQRRLGECFDERDERTADGELISVTINDGIKRFEELGRHDNSSDDKSRYKRVEIGDIAYNSMRMWQGASGYSPYKGIVSPAYTILIPKFEIDSLFFSYVFKRPQQIHIFQIRSQGITSDTWNLKYPAFSQIETRVPNFLEQKKIGAFFRHLDRLITLHQSKRGRLENIKKAMLEKMFPKNGADVPEIRFAGFTDAWEQRRLGDVAGRVIRKNMNNEASLPLTISAKDGLVDQTAYFNNRVASQNTQNYYLILNGEFAYNRSTSNGSPFGAIKRLDLYKNGVLSTLYIVFSIKNEVEINSDFLTIFFETDYWHKHISEHAAEGARNHGLLNISTEDFFDLALFIPSKEQEQSRIGAFFRHLDRLITLHQRKVELLQNIKKACLETMFV